MKQALQLIIGVLGLSLLLSCNKSIEMKTVRLGVANQPSSALIHIALAKGFFESAGLKVIPNYYISGKRALLDGFSKGELDYFTAADAPFIIQLFADSDIVALAQTYTVDNVNRIVARRDRGIETLADLKGKVIATQRNSAVHHFLHSVLIEEGISHDEVDIQFFRGNELPQKLISGEIDAFSMREPYVSEAANALGENAVVMAAPGVYVQNDLLVSSRPIVQNDPEVARRLLTGLLAAEAFALKNRKEAIHIVATSIGSTPEKIDQALRGLDLEVSLDQSMLMQLSKVLEWVSDDVITDADMPNLLEHLEPGPLEAVRPDRVSIVGF